MSDLPIFKRGTPAYMRQWNIRVWGNRKPEFEEETDSVIHWSVMPKPGFEGTLNVFHLQDDDGNWITTVNGPVVLVIKDGEHQGYHVLEAGLWKIFQDGKVEEVESD